ncbi:hypothetical protein IAT40_003074 [Kwoniella sp. CBS 6097]
MSNPTPSRSRKSSIASRRAPASLRIPSLTRRASNPNTQLSFVFAQGDSARPHALSEDALSKQLDGDLGGKQMGLRSRRSSSATVRTVRTSRTASGLRSPTDDSESVMEEDESERERSRISDSPEPMAGPSTSNHDQPKPSSPHLVDQPIERPPYNNDDVSSARTLGRGTINPKSSSSWLRWTSPTPSFPRSPSVHKGKGKGKAKEMIEDDSVITVPSPKSRSDNTSPSDQVPTASAAIKEVPSNSVTDDVLPSNTLKPPDAAKSLSKPEPVLRAEPVQPTVPAPTPTSTRRGWFGKSSNAQSQTVASKPNPPSSTPEVTTLPITTSLDAPLPTSEIVSAEPVDNLSPGSPSMLRPASISSDPATTLAPSLSLSRSVSRADPTSATSSATIAPAGRWKGYLGWGGDSKASAIAERAGSDHEQPEVVETASSQLVEGGGQCPRDTEPSSANDHNIFVPALADDHVNESTRGHESESAGTSGTPAQPWSSYLYSFIVPETRPPKSKAQPGASSNFVEPSAPDQDQRPVHLEPPPTKDESFTAATAVPDSSPVLSSSIPSESVFPAFTVDRRSSTTGWLNYLAFRASQKKIESSSVTTNDTAGKNDGDVAHQGEEVMDFSSDPDFPTASDPSKPTPRTLAPPAALKSRDVRATAESIRSITPKPSQNLDVRAKKRLSNASIVSNGSLAPVSASPKSRSSLDQSRPGTSVSKNVGSALPPAPQPPASQPNLVIPTFSDTFDRPPRSLLPVSLSTETTVPASHGITAATTGLAWKALGAVGSYVYGGTHDSQKVTSETIHEDEKETRGRKEGRQVGADLPRRIGLGAGTPDDGWKHVKRVVVVGVHGWFPAKMLNSVIGEPTGTSVKFANMMGQAVKQFFHDNGVEDFRLTLMPLEGEGTIESRVDRLYKAYLSNPAWINDLRRADAIFFAAHSQGCIVTTHLISRMIAQGHIRTSLNGEAVARCEWAFGPIGVVPDEPRRGRRGTSVDVQGSEGGHQKVAMLAMCGVHLGPLYSIRTSSVIQPYLQWFENAAARELFEFQDSASAVSQAYQKALSMVLENEVRVVLLASLNDQVVPIYGASFSTATHPLLLRALYVDGASYTQSDFMTNLLCFAFMLRNAGIDDQRLVEHLSEATAGSLTGVGHSTPYEELSCYSLAVEYLFHSGSTRQPIPPLEVESFSARDAKNDFELPWIMRALVDSPEVKDLFPIELKDLKEGVLNWRPTTKALREIKKRLEPMAGRQSRLRAIHTSPSTTSLASAHEQAQLALATSPGKAGGNVAGVSNGPGMNGNKGLTSGEISSSKVKIKSRM